MCNILTGLLLLCAVSVAAAQRVQSGEIECGNDSTWSPAPGYTNNGREIAKTVTFATPYCKPPTVLLSITILDVDKSKDTRIWSRLLDVSSTGFKAACHTWLDSKVIRMALKWVAIEN